jgi:GH43 family beta-xylosidase
VRWNLTMVFIVIGISVQCQRAKTFTNPLLPSGADPWAIYHDGYYYYTNTYRDQLSIWKTKNLSTLRDAERKVVWKPPAGTLYSNQIWAPELHYIDGAWYMYFSADDGKNENHRIYAITNSSADPLEGEWKFAGKVSDSSDRWAIDATVMKIQNTLYMAWSGWEGTTDGRQDIFIAKMKDPLTIEGKRVRISTPEFSWETFGPVERRDSINNVAVNEGPQFLLHNDQVFLIYSSSGCWTEKYNLGMLTASVHRNLLDSTSWKKHPEPVFSASPDDNVFAPGHNSFFKSPDGTEDWILYHANDNPGEGCGRHRSPRAQKFTWTIDGFPDFGEPLPINTVIAEPSTIKK